MPGIQVSGGIRLTSQALFNCQRIDVTLSGSRYACMSTVATKSLESNIPRHQLETNVRHPERTFQRLPTLALLRSVILGQIFKSPVLFKSGLFVLEKIANSQSVWLDADKNPLIRSVVSPLVYKQFCAGRNKTEVQQTISQIKQMGYSGVILCYSKEVMARVDSQGNQIVNHMSGEDTSMREVEAWRDGNLATLSAVGEGDYIGVK